MTQNKNNDNFLERAAKTLYGNLSKQEIEKKSLRESLLEELDGYLSKAQIIYSSIGELKKMKQNISQQVGAFKSFSKNYHDMKRANTIGSDKYFHAKANCESAQYGLKGANIAKKLSDLREDTDLIKNKYKKKKNGTKMSSSEIIEDYRDDNCANLYGRLQGLQNPNKNCKDLVEKYRPKGLNDRY